MLTKAVKISKKGQVTIPKVIREKLGTNIVSFVIEKDEVKIKPVDKETYGRLKRYSKRYIPIEEARETAWGSVTTCFFLLRLTFPDGPSALSLRML